MDQSGPSGLGYLDGPSFDDSLYDPSLFSPSYASLTPMRPSSSSSALDSPSHQPSSFMISADSISLFEPYKSEMEWLDRPLPLRDDVARESVGVAEGGGREEEYEEEEGRQQHWSDRMETENDEDDGEEMDEEKRKKMKMNRLRMAEKRARETDAERRERLERAKEYSRSKVQLETPDQRDRRREDNRVRSAARRIKKMSEKRSLEAQVQPPVVRAGGEEGGEMGEENGEGKNKRLESVREDGTIKSRRETPEKRKERMEKNRERMRRARATKKDEWMSFIGQREMIEERLGVLRMQLGDKSPLLESDPVKATRLTELIKEMAAAPRKKEKYGKMDALRCSDRFFTKDLPPLLSELESLLSNGESRELREEDSERREEESEEGFIFGQEASYLDYALFEELDAMSGICLTVLDDYPTLKEYRDRFHERINITTYAIMQAGSTLNLSYESAMGNLSATVSADFGDDTNFEPIPIDNPFL